MRVGDQTYSGLLGGQGGERVDDALVVALQHVGQTANHVQLVLLGVHDLLLLLLVLLEGLLHHLHSSCGGVVLGLQRLDRLHLSAERLRLLLHRLELRQVLHAHLLDLLVHFADVLGALQQLLVLLVQLLLQRGDLLVQSELQHAGLLLLLVEVHTVLSDLLLHHLLLGRDGLSTLRQSLLLVVDHLHHRGESRVVGGALLVELLHHGFVHRVHVRVGLVEALDHGVDGHQLRLDLVHSQLRRLPVALQTVLHLCVLRLQLLLQRRGARRDLLQLREVLLRQRVRLGSLRLDQLVVQTGDGLLHRADVLSHLALAFVQTDNLATKLVGNLHQFLTRTHQRILGSSHLCGSRGGGGSGSS